MGIALGKGFSFNARSILVAAINDAGYPMGLAPDPNAPSLNTVYGAHRLGLRSLEHPEREVSRAFNREDGRIKQRVIVGVSDDGEGTFEVGTDDEEFNIYITEGGYDNTTSDEILMQGRNRGMVSNRAYFLMAGRLIQLDSGGLWVKYFTYHNNQLEQTSIGAVSQDDGENPNPLEYTFTPSLAERTITGQPFSGTDMTVYDDKDLLTEIRCRNELHQCTWIANGTADEFTLPYLPLKSDVAVGGANIICLNGVPTAASALSTTTGVLELTAAGSSGDIWTVLYQTAWRSSPA